LVIRRAARDLDLRVEIAGMPTIRAADGLALSSRNRYLDPEERRAAPRLHAVLHAVAEALRAGESAAPLLARARADLEAAGFGPVQYLEVRDALTL
ncbi:pantoate--beta-alanine ligase, partial [Methylobacterium brachiatum]